MAANSDDRRTGVNGAIYLGGGVASGGTRIAAKSGFTFSASRDFFDGSAFGDSNKHWFAGLRDAQGTFEGLLDCSGDTLFNAAALGAQLIYLYADDGTGASSGTVVEVAHGSGFIDATVNVSLNDMAKISGNFRASANWTFVV